MSLRFAEWYLKLLLRHRLKVVGMIVLVTISLGYFLAQVRVYTNFFNLYPPNHPYIQLYQQYRKMFGSANVLVVAVEVEKGTIFDTETLSKLDRMTRYLMDTPGVNPQQVISLTHPKLKIAESNAWGINVQSAMREGVPTSEEGLRRLRERVYQSEEIRGFYVSADDKAATIFAGFWEEGLDLNALFERMQQLKQAEEDGNHRIYITGYPMLFAWIIQYLSLTIVIMGITAVAIALLLWFYFRTWTGVWVPMLSGALSSAWALGFAGLFGFDLDPLVLVVFLLITARALSHSVQSMERFHDEYRVCGDREAAVVASYRALFAPAMLSIASDGVAIVTLATVTIPVIRNVALVSSFWVITIAISVVTLHPVLLTFLPPPKPDPKAGTRFSDQLYNSINRACVRLSRGRTRYAVAGCFVLAIGFGLYFSHFLKVGDTNIGKALLYPNHPYNVAFDFVNQHFVGSSQLVVIAEGERPNAIANPDVLQKLSDFQIFMERTEDATRSITITDLLKRVYRLYHEGDPRWEALPDDPDHLAQLFYLVEAGAGPGEMERFFSKDYQNATITIFYRNYANDVIKRAIRAAREFIESNPIEGVRFRLAGGLMGILAAVNEEVEWSYTINLYLVLVTVFILSLATYRSVVGALIVMLPSLVAQPLSEGVMYAAGIDMNINSLPVAAIGIGIGIDYGYYVLSRIVEELRLTRDFDEANERALMSTGRAILFTGTTLTASVIFWLWFPMKFQAEMALLLTLLLSFHVVGALVFIPAAVSLLKPRFAMLLATPGRDLEEGEGEPEGITELESYNTGKVMRR